MPEVRSPNTRLRSLLAECSWSGADLARAVNSAGREAGLALRYQRPSVAQWLSGSVPRSPGPELVAEALTRHLGRTVTPAQAGFSTQRPAGALECPSTTRALRTLAVEAARQTAHVYSVERLSRVPRVAGSGRYQAVSAVDHELDLSLTVVQGIRDLTAFFVRTSRLLGAEGVRAALTACLTSIAHCLSLQTRPAVHWELRRAAATLTRLCGSVYDDDELYGTAQEFYYVSAALADESGDRAHLAAALRALSMQARHLGHYPAALDLAQAAVDQGRQGRPGSLALLHGQLAASFAALQDGPSAEQSLRTADTYIVLHSASPQPSPSSARVIRAQHAYHHATVAWHLGERTRAITALKLCLRLCPAEMSHPRAIVLARIAEMQAQEGHLDRACETWSHFLTHRSLARSRSIESAVVVMQATLAPHRDRADARALLQRAIPPGTAPGRPSTAPSPYLSFLTSPHPPRP
ncbi:hypothetical protein [Streptomyces sp. NBC_00690]|uniref:hypothetical protein n=1 Tax=Streptomyces sp. NBC_00690 TaxID=2975808 RepID=UPI002E28871F|nr:hypothetical protein [Streptomyces sp. NBC_00690]